MHKYIRVLCITRVSRDFRPRALPRAQFPQATFSPARWKPRPSFSQTSSRKFRWREGEKETTIVRRNIRDHGSNEHPLADLEPWLYRQPASKTFDKVTHFEWRQWRRWQRREVEAEWNWCRRWTRMASVYTYTRELNKTMDTYRDKENRAVWHEILNSCENGII